MAANEQIIVTFGREYGSGGHVIAKKLADTLGINYYDKKKLVEGTAELSGIDKGMIKKLDEKPAGFPFSGRIGTFADTPESNVAYSMFDYIRKIADSGESCVIVGRCADTVLAGRDNVLRIFVTGDQEDKVDRIAHIRKISEKEAAEECKETDNLRRTYHNYYSDTKWGDSRAYDLIINTSRLGLNGSYEIVKDFVESYIDKA